MQAVTVVIRGHYYDSQIYSGRLFLWTIDRDIIVMDWNKIIQDLTIDPDLEIAMHCAFLNSNYLYGDDWKLFFQDREIKSVIKKKFESIAGRRLEVRNSEKYIVNRIKNFFPFPHADSDIYYGNMLVASRSGTFHSKITSKEIRNARILTEIPTLKIAPYKFLLALSCGNEGVYEVNPLHKIDRMSKTNDIDYSESNIKQIAKINANASDWIYQSVFSSSYAGDFGIAKYDIEPRGRNVTELDKIHFFRDRKIIEEYISSEEVLLRGSGRSTSEDSEIVSWGVKDKVCAARGSHLSAYSYLPWMPKSKQLNHLRDFSLGNELGDIIAGNSTNFGYIVEREEGLQILQSSSNIDIISEEPTNWRVFNRSKNYTNQLHIIFDDRIEITSYNDDYFLEQENKTIGLNINTNIKDSKSYRTISS